MFFSPRIKNFQIAHLHFDFYRFYSFVTAVDDGSLCERNGCHYDENVNRNRFINDDDVNNAEAGAALGNISNWLLLIIEQFTLLNVLSLFGFVCQTDIFWLSFLGDATIWALTPGSNRDPEKFG